MPGGHYLYFSVTYYATKGNSFIAVLCLSEAKGMVIMMRDALLYELRLLDWFWVNGNKDDPDDLCLHGNVYVRIGNDVIADSYSCTVSASGLYLLRSIENDHTAECEHMFPCCGHFMIPADDLASVNICGCPNGIQLLVTHSDSNVKLTTMAKSEISLPIDEYKAIVEEFVREIERVYEQNQRQLPTDEFDRNGYTAFWNEWRGLKQRHFSDV
jgi:hypothetical protein